MSLIIELVERLLDILAMAGRAALAERYRMEFAARGRADLTQADVTRVSQCIADPATCDARPPRVEPADEVEAEASPHYWSPSHDFGLFVDGIPSGRLLLKAINRLALADDPDDAIGAARALFVDILGYDPGRHDETDRLGDQTTITRLVRIGHFGEFVVSLAVTDYAGPYSTVCSPVFRLHPYGLVIWVIPDRQMVRFVYRAGVERTWQMRTLAGGRLGREPHDNLIIWTARLAELEPRMGDDSVRLVERTWEALSTKPHALWGQRASAPVTQGQPTPGIDWSNGWHRGFTAFVQGYAPSPRWLWGLARVLRERFPMFVERGQGRLVLRDWRIDPGKGSGASAQVTLSCVLVGEARREAIEVRAILPAFDATGGWLSQGQRWRLVPRVREGGHLFNRPIEFAVDADEIDADEDDWPDVEEGLLSDEGFDEDREPPAAELVDDEQAPEMIAEVSATPRELDEGPGRREGEQELEFEGADLCTLLEIAVARKLGAIARRAWFAPVDAEAIRGIFVGLRDADGDLHLASGGYLRAVLSPVPARDLLSLLVTEVGLPQDPPAWACLDLSADLPLGRWHPVAGARLTPSGGLALPLRDADGRVRLRMCERLGPEVNPRSGGDAGTAAEEWIAAPLRRWSALPAGRLRWPSRLVMGERLDLDGENLRVRPGPRTVLYVSLPALRRWPCPPPREVVVDVPAAESDARRGGAVPPRLHLAVGQRARPGEVWLSAARHLWGEQRPSIRDRAAMGALGLLDNIFVDDPDCADCMAGTPTGFAEVEDVLYRLSTDTEGVVVEAELIERFARFGQLRGWRARVVIRRSAGLEDQVAWLPDGRVVDVEPLFPGDAPPAHEASNVALADEPGFLLEDARLDRPPIDPWCLPDDLWADETIRPNQSITFAAIDRIARSDGDRPRRWRDDGWIPASGSPAALTEARRRRWSLIAPEGAERLDAHERRWSGGLPPHVSGLLDVLIAGRTLAGGPLDRPRPLFRPLRGFWGPRVSVAGAVVRTEPEAVSGHRLDWGCRCGAVSGPHRALERCDRSLHPEALSISGCGARALPILRAPPDWPGVSLAERLPHPWRRSAVAVLLGLTADELREHVIRMGGDVVSVLIRGAWVSPFAAVSRRMASDPPRPVRLALRHAVAELRRLLAHGVDRHDLMLRWIPLPSERLCPDGYAPGAPDMAQAPLTRRYRNLQLANARLKTLRTRDGVPTSLVQCGRASLLDHLDALFGDPDRRTQAEPHDLAGLIRRIWPLTRAPGLRSTLPGLMMLRGARLAGEGETGMQVRCDAHDPLLRVEREEPSTRGTPADLASDLYAPDFAFEVDLMPDDPAHERALIALGPDDLIVEPTERSDRPVTADDWGRHITRRRFWDEFATPLAVVLGALTWDEPVGPEPSAWPGVDEVLARGPTTDGVPIGRMITAPLLRRLDDPSPLVAHLTRDVPLWLPADPVAARSRLSGPIEAAFAGCGTLISWGRALLAGVLAGWVRRERSPVDEALWAWHPATTPAGTRRGLPPLTHRAWHDWPGAMAALDPVRWFALGGEWNPAVRALAGYDRPPLPTATPSPTATNVSLPAENEPEAMQPRIAPAPIVVTRDVIKASSLPAAGSDAIRPLTSTLASWLSHVTRPVSTEEP